MVTKRGMIGWIMIKNFKPSALPAVFASYIDALIGEVVTTLDWRTSESITL